jgi:solute carrier family 25 (adenine nucleotide translocator) protein 4/5/6/31
MSRDDDDRGDKGKLKPPISSGPYKWLTDFHKDLMAGALLGGVVHTIVAPIERAKVLLQTQESNLAIVGNGRRKFKGMVDCIVRIRRRDSFALERQ